MIFVAALVLGVPGESLHEHLLTARSGYAQDIDRFAWRSHHLVNNALEDRAWSDVKPSLIRQGFSVDQDYFSGGSYMVRIHSEKLNYTLGGGIPLVFEIGLDVRAVPSKTAVTTFVTRVSWTRLIAKPEKPFAEIAPSLFPARSVGAQTLNRPTFVKLLNRFPTLSQVSLQYRQPLAMLGVDYGGPPPVQPYKLEVDVDLSGQPGDSGVGLRYAADSRLDPKATPGLDKMESWPKGLSSFAAPEDTFNSEERALEEAARPAQPLDNSFLWMVDWPDPGMSDEEEAGPPTAHSRADLLALPASITTLELHAEGLNKGDLSALRRFKNLKTFSLRGSSDHILEADLLEVAKVATLEDVSLWCLRLGDPTAIALAELPRLRTANISGERLTDRGMVALAQNKSLREFFLFRCKSASDKTLQAIAKNPDLQALSLPHGAKFTDAGVSQLANLRKLESIDLRSISSVKPATLQFLSRLPRLREITLWDAQVDESLMRRIGRIPHLRRVDFERVTGLNDVNLQLLAPATDLETLQISDCKAVTLEGLESLRKKMPRPYRTPATNLPAPGAG